MYDTARRVMLVKKRALACRRRRQRREFCGLSALCTLLFMLLAGTVGTAAGPVPPDARGTLGAMLLREDAGGYVLVGVVSFAAAVVITVLCVRLRDREERKKDAAESHASQKQEG